jgi:hypothetical protein
MILFWRKKAAFRDKKNVPEGEEESADDVLYLGFTLCKVDVEHLCALQSIAAAIGVAVGNLYASFMHVYGSMQRSYIYIYVHICINTYICTYIYVFVKIYIYCSMQRFSMHFCLYI